MTPVYQTKYGSEGNCLAACVATLLGVPLTAIPEFSGDGGEWFEELHSFCRENNLFLLYWSHSKSLPILSLNAYVIVILELEETGVFHAVIGRTVVESRTPITDLDVERRTALSDIIGDRLEDVCWDWRTELVHDPNERHPPAKGPVGYIMIGKQEGKHQ